MRRKSERNKSKTSPEKKPSDSTSRKSKRHSRRRKRSSSRSGSDDSDDVPLKKPTKSPEPEVTPPSDDPKKSSHSNSEDDNQEHPVWKVKAAETPSGEIQKIKLCLTRPPTTPERTERSPRRRKTSSKSSNQPDDEHKDEKSHKRHSRKSSITEDSSQDKSSNDSAIEGEKDENLIIIKETNEACIGEGKLDSSHESQDSETEECVQNSQVEESQDKMNATETKPDVAEKTQDNTTEKISQVQREEVINEPKEISCVILVSESTTAEINQIVIKNDDKTKRGTTDVKKTQDQESMLIKKDKVKVGETAECCKSQESIIDSEKKETGQKQTGESKNTKQKLTTEEEKKGTSEITQKKENMDKIEDEVIVEKQNVEIVKEDEVRVEKVSVDKMREHEVTQEKEILDKNKENEVTQEKESENKIKEDEIRLDIESIEDDVKDMGCESKQNQDESKEVDKNNDSDVKQECEEIVNTKYMVTEQGNIDKEEKVESKVKQQTTHPLEVKVEMPKDVQTEKEDEQYSGTHEEPVEEDSDDNEEKRHNKRQQSSDISVDDRITDIKEKSPSDVADDSAVREIVSNENQNDDEEVERRPRKRIKWGKYQIKLPEEKRITYNLIMELCPSLKLMTEEEVVLEIEETVKHTSKSMKIEERKLIIKSPPSGKEEDIKEEDKEVSNIGLNRKISIVNDEASKLQPPPSPSKNPVSSILFITNLVRPFTLKQLKELLSRTGTILDDGFWTDRIKSKCYVQYDTEDEALATRNALHGVQWPIGNGKKLIIDFGTTEDMEAARNASTAIEAPPVAKHVPEKIIEKVVENKKEETEKNNKYEKLKMSVPVREWDLGKLSQEHERSPRNRNKERDKSRTERDKDRNEKRRHSSPSNGEQINERKIKKKEEEMPAKLMDDLFHKTKAVPSIYWLPLTPEMIAKKQQERLQRMAEHKRRLEESRRVGRDFGRGAPRSRRHSGRYDD